jgi:hypothetical protein
MILLSWFDALFVGSLVVGLLVQFGMKWRQSPEELGYALLKQKAAALGVDVDRIPDPAWYAIVDMSIASARDRAMHSRTSLQKASARWQADLAGTLEEEAVEISKFVQGSPCNRNAVAPHILTEYRV